MKIFVLAIAMFVLNVYVTRATSLDPVENARMDDAENKSDDTRTKRSGELFSSLLKKKFGLLSSLSGGSTSGKSFDPFPEQYEEPLSFDTKSFNLWGVKKAILSSVLQAAKAITGGVIALKGNLITAKGHVVVAKGKLMQTKGQAISNFGKTIATHAFDSHNEAPQFENSGLFNHLPVVPVHQPTSYGAATAFGYQQSYPVSLSHAYPSGNGYQVAARNQFAPTGYAVPQIGYGGGGEYPAYGGGNNGYTAKRAVIGNAATQESVINQVKNEFNKDSVRAGLLIFKPIKMPQNLPLSLAAAQSVRAQQTVGQRPAHSSAASIGATVGAAVGAKVGAATAAAFPLTSLKSGFQNAFNRFQSAKASHTNGGADRAPPSAVYQTEPDDRFQTPGQYAGGYSPFQNAGYPSPVAAIAQSAEYRFPATGSGTDGGASVENVPVQEFAHPNFADFPQVPGSQEFDRQLSGFPDQQQQQRGQKERQQREQRERQQREQKERQQQERQQLQESLQRERLQQEQLEHAAALFSQEHFGHGGDQHQSASVSEEHVEEPSYKRARWPQAAGLESRFVEPDFLLPTTHAYDDEADEAPAAKYPSVRSAHDDHGLSARSTPSPSQESIVPLQYQHNGSDAEEQARLKQTVHRFFDMLKKQS